MSINIIVGLLATLLQTAVPLAEAQQAGRTPVIGMLFFGSRDQPHLESFKGGLRDLGYVEGKNVRFEYRYAEGIADRLAPLAAELVSSH